LACRVRASPFELLFTPVHRTSFRPGVHFHCDINFDPFVYMHENNKTYGSCFLMPCPLRYTVQLDWTQGSPSRCTSFNVRSSRYGRLCYVNRPLARLFLTEHADLRPPSLADFIAEHPEYLAPNNAMNFLSDNGGVNYNLCHCTSVSPSNF